MAMSTPVENKELELRVVALVKHSKFVIMIQQTHLYNFDPHKPHLYIVKLGFTGVYIIFLISAQKT